MGKRSEQKESKSQKVEPKEEEDKNENKPVPLDDDADNQGFSTWLRSNEGTDMMRLFVIANSLFIFVTMGWPSMQSAFQIIKEFFFGEEDDDEYIE